MAIREMKLSTKRRYEYPDDYVTQIFITWYNNGKPSHEKLHAMIHPFEETGDRPSKQTLRNWIKDEFVPMGFHYDEDVQRSLQTTLVGKKVEMFNRHAEMAKRMQEIGIAYLDEHGVKNARDAIRLWVEGTRIENESTGLDSTLRKISQWDDNRLLEELKRASLEGPIISIEPND